MNIKQVLKKSFLGLFCFALGTASALAQAPTYTTPGGTSSNNFPFNSSSSNKVQWVFNPSEFSPSLVPGLITHVYFRTDNAQNSTRTFTGYRISIKEVNYSTMSGSNFETGLSVAYGPTTVTINIGSDGWFGVPLATPFSYDGTSSLIIEAHVSATNGVRVDQNTSNGAKRRWGNVSSSTGSSGTGQTACGLEILTCSTAITQQPLTKTICEGTSTFFEIDAVDVGNYQWQVDEGAGFTDIVNGTYYSGATTDKLGVNNAPFAFDGYEYRCMITQSSCADSSDSVKLNVNGLVKLTDLAPNDTTCINSIKELEVNATGSITNYQWQMFDKNQNAYVNVPNSPPYNHMGNILRINGAPLSLHNTKFRVSVDGVCDSDISSDLLLAVNDVPNVAVPPADVNTKQGQSVKFEVKSTVTPARYQWQVASPNDTFVNINEGGIYIGARSNKLEVLGVTRVQNNFKFRCVVSTASSCAAPGDTSNFGILFVEPATSVETITGDGKLSLYPNPATDELYIQSSKSVSGMEYVVLDRTGRVVLTGEMSDTQDTRVDVSSLPSSMYIVKILNANKQLDGTMKFTKM